MDESSCPLCTEDLDPTDLLLAPRLCHCRFAVCLWCFRRLTEDAGKENRPALCPNCREPYDIDRITQEGRELDPEQVEEVKRKKGKPEEKKKLPALRPRKDLANVRVVQRNLVYVVGLPMEVCYEDRLSSPDYIGQFGKIVKISVSRSGPYGNSQAKNGPTGSAYVTFKRNEDARHCIESIHGTLWEGKLVKACYGTTKYCNAFLKGLACNNGDCLYLHDVAMEEDSYTKEETKSTKFVNLVHAASLNQGNGAANGQLYPNSSMELGQVSSGLEPVSHDINSSMDDENSDAQGWPSLGWTWEARQASSLLPAQSVPQADDPNAWPDLPGNSGQTTGPASSAETSETEAEAAPARPGQAARASPTMAHKIARANSGAKEPGGKDKEAGGKKLTPLHGKQRLAAEEGRAPEGQDAGRLSPPHTPQLISKPASKNDSSPEADTSSLPQSSLSAGVKPEVPPGFFQAAGKPKLVAPPPGFSDVSFSQGLQQFPSGLKPFGSEPVRSQGTEYNAASKSIWTASDPVSSDLSRGNAGSLPAYQQPAPQPRLRTRSRFQFANSGNHEADSAPLQEDIRQQTTPSYDDGSSQNGYFGGPFGTYGSSVYSAVPPGYSFFNQAKSDSEENLPAGLVLLRKLQAQGGITTSKPSPAGNPSGNPGDDLHTFFQDPAALSAAPSWNSGSDRSWLDFGGEHASAAQVQEPVNPKTPPRRRKSKAGGN